MQTRTLSFVEACVNTAFGFTIQVGAQWTLFWVLAIPISTGNFWLFTVVMTVLSVGRGFVIRRLFNSEFWKSWKRNQVGMKFETCRLTEEEWKELHDRETLLRHTPVAPGAPAGRASCTRYPS